MNVQIYANIFSPSVDGDFFLVIASAFSLDHDGRNSPYPPKTQIVPTLEEAEVAREELAMDLQQMLEWRGVTVHGISYTS